MDLRKLFSKRNSIIAAIVTFIVFILLAGLNGIISDVTVAFTHWFWDLITRSIKTNSETWIVTFAIITLVQFTALSIMSIAWYNSKGNNAELEEKELELDTKSKELDTLNKQIETKNKTINDLEAKINTFLQSDNLLVDRLHTGITRVFPQTVNFNWINYINNSTDVTMIKLRHNISEDPAIYEAFEALLKRKGSVTLIMSDPRSPAMWLRYMEEPIAKYSENHPDETTWVDGLEDLAIILYRLDNWRQHLIQKDFDISKLSIKVALNYPTQAFYKLDDQIFFHHYPYLERGFHAPTFLFTSAQARTHQFLCRCINSIVRDAIPLEKEIGDIWKKYRAGLFSDREVHKYRLTVTKSRARTTNI